MSLWDQGFGVFLAMFATDMMWAMYTRQVADRKPLAAAAASVGLLVMGALVTLSYVTNPILLLPAAAGGFAGTWLAVRLEGPR